MYNLKLSLSKKNEWVGDETSKGLGCSRAGLGAAGPLRAAAIVSQERWTVRNVEGLKNSSPAGAVCTRLLFPVTEMYGLQLFACRGTVAGGVVFVPFLFRWYVGWLGVHTVCDVRFINANQQSAMQSFCITVCTWGTISYTLLDHTFHYPRPFYKAHCGDLNIWMCYHHVSKLGHYFQ